MIHLNIQKLYETKRIKMFFGETDLRLSLGQIHMFLNHSYTVWYVLPAGLCIDLINILNLNKSWGGSTYITFEKELQKENKRLPKLLLVTLKIITFIIIVRSISWVNSKNGNKNRFYYQLSACSLCLFPRQAIQRISEMQQALPLCLLGPATLFSSPQKPACLILDLSCGLSIFL